MVSKFKTWNFHEYLLILSVLFYWYSTNNLFNPIAILLISVLVLQIILKKKFLGIGISIIVIFICSYMMLALISEVREFPRMTFEAFQLLSTGSLFFISTSIIAFLMLYKNSLQKKLQ